MQIGAVLSQNELGADVAVVRDYAQAVRDLGYDFLVVADHVVGADPAAHPDLPRVYPLDSILHEPFALFAFIAGVAPRLGLLTSVIILPQRQTVLAAKQAAEIDLMTGGRFRLGVGIGWHQVEFEVLGVDFKSRARRFEEQIELMRRLWQEPIISFEGRYERVTGAGINPLPIQRPIPVWIGGSAEPALKRAAEIADGFFPQRPLEGGWAATFEKMRGWREAAGRDWATFGIQGRIQAGTGTPDDWRREAEEWRLLGVTHLSANTMNGGLTGPDAHIRRIREVTEALGPELLP